MKFIVITNKPNDASAWSKAGVQRIMVDLEYIGKAKRQSNLNAHFGGHKIDDIPKVKRVSAKSELVVRVNPLHSQTFKEVNDCIDSGADRLMLPMFQSQSEVSEFNKIVNKRLPITYLTETKEALVRLPSIVEHLNKGDDIYFGLNDLSLSLGVKLFEPLCGNLLGGACALLNFKNIPFGIGGIGTVKRNKHKFPPRYLLACYINLGASWVILSRAFTNTIDSISEVTQKNDYTKTLLIEIKEEIDKIQNFSPTQFRKYENSLRKLVFTDC